jgi:hypothetical protein
LNRLLSLVVDGLKYLDLKFNDNLNKKQYGLVNSPKIRNYFLDYLFYTLLLPYSANSLAINKAATTTQVPSAIGAVLNSTPTEGAFTELSHQQRVAQSAVQSQQTSINNELPPCFSENVYKRFKNNINLENGDELEQTKIGILKFLAHNIYENEEILFHFIVSTSDTRYSVVQVAEIHIKRIVGSVDLNDQNIVNRFMQIFLGDKAKIKVVNAASTSSDPNRIEPANTRIRLKLFPYMLRSRTASCTMPLGIQLVFDCLFNSSSLYTNQKIKTYAVQFVHMIALK